jgi:Rieske Fe-S protein|tara:strand:- start:61 stop:666 length:606 start_codon:yes stop_codon:yes gene_type:complete
MKNKIKKSKCDCNCFEEKAVDSSRRDFIRKASTLTLIGSTAFILEACGGGSSSPTSSYDDTDDGDTGDGDTGDGDTGDGDTGYNFDASTGTITIDITKIHQSLQTVGSGIELRGSITFTSLGLIVIRESSSSVRALSRNCTHAGFSVDFGGDSLPCSQQSGSHGSIFNLDGSVQKGPATRALTSYNASINSEGTLITITQS